MRNAIVRGTIVFACLALGTRAYALASTLSIDSWRLTCSVAAGGPNIVGHSFDSLSNPFVSQDGVSLLNSAAQAAYNFLWTELNASFVSDIHATAQGPVSTLPFRSANSSSIVITPLVDLLVDVSGSLTYALAPGDRQADFQLTIEPTNFDDPPVLNLGRSASPIFGDPASGTFNLGGSVILHPGQSYQLVYTATLTSYIGSPTQMSNYTGHIEFAVTALPEPAGLSALTFAAFLLVRRRRY